MGTWIDGKTLYQITHHIVLSSPMEPNTDTTISLPATTALQVRFREGGVIGGYRGTQAVISRYATFNSLSPSGDAQVLIVSETADSLVVRTGNNFGNFPSANTDNRIREFWVTRRYTKSS